MDVRLLLTFAITTALLVFLFIGNVEIAASIGVAELFIKLASYYIHERLWNCIPETLF